MIKSCQIKMYLLVKNGTPYECRSLLEVASHFDISVTESGHVICDGKDDTITYNINQWTEKETISDYIKHRLTKKFSNVTLYSVFNKI